MRLILACCAALAAYTLTFIAWGAVQKGVLPAPDRLAGSLGAAALMLALGALLVTGPAWLVARQRLKGPAAWTLTGAAAGLVSGLALILFVKNLADALTGVAQPVFDLQTILDLARVTLAGALAHLAGWWAGRRAASG